MVEERRSRTAEGVAAPDFRAAALFLFDRPPAYGTAGASEKAVRVGIVTRHKVGRGARVSGR